MSTLEIRKLQSGAFKHVDSIDGEFFLGRFSFKNEFNIAFLVEAYGAKRRTYSIGDIAVYNYLGTVENFTNFTDLINRLVALNYTGIDTNNIINGFLSDDPTTYTSATLPLTGTEVAILNDGVNWVKITWNNIKAQLKTYFDTIYQAILVSGTNIKTINGTSILGSGDLVVGGGGAVTLIHKFTGSGTSVTNSPNFTAVHTYGVLIPANTVAVGDFVKFEAAFEKVSGGAVDFFHEVFINTINSLSGATNIASTAESPNNRVFSKLERTLAVKSSSVTEIFHHGTQVASDYRSAATSGNRDIDWTTDKYIIFAVKLNGATDAIARLSSCLITKI